MTSPKKKKTAHDPITNTNFFFFTQISNNIFKMCYLTLEKNLVKPTEKKCFYYFYFLMPRLGAEEKVKERTSK